MSTPIQPARDLATRNLYAVAALLPGLLLQLREDHALAARLAFALAVALALEALALRLRRQPLAPYLREGSACCHALLLVAWLPTLHAAGLLTALFVALVLARQAFGGLGRNLFHPVAAGLAFAQATSLASSAAWSTPNWLLPAWLGGGLALLALRIVRWQAPVFLLAGACAGALAFGHGLGDLADPRWMLAAFFIAGDPVTTPEDPRARALAAAATGLLAGVLGIAALPFAVLAMNASAPLLDQACARRLPRMQRA